MEDPISGRTVANQKHGDNNGDNEKAGLTVLRNVRRFSRGWSKPACESGRLARKTFEVHGGDGCRRRGRKRAERSRSTPRRQDFRVWKAARRTHRSMIPKRWANTV